MAGAGYRLHGFDAFAAGSCYLRNVAGLASPELHEGRVPGKERYVSVVAAACTALAVVARRDGVPVAGELRVLRDRVALLGRPGHANTVRARAAPARLAGRVDGGAGYGRAGPLSKPSARQLAGPVHAPGGRIRARRQRTPGALLRGPADLHRPRRAGYRAGSRIRRGGRVPGRVSASD